jgi:hypothetical protein
LKRLIDDFERKVFLILDNLRVPHVKVLRLWLKEHEKEIEVFCLPVYSLELSPVECLNCDLKSGVFSSSPL